MTVVKVNHAQFTYFEEIGSKIHKRTGEEVPKLNRRFAVRGQIVDVPREEDFQKGLKSGAVESVSSEELLEENEEETEQVEDGELVELDWDSHDDLVMWIRDDKPTALEVVKHAQNDPEKAGMLMMAEEEASGSQPRKSVMDPLKRIAEK